MDWGGVGWLAGMLGFLCEWNQTESVWESLSLHAPDSLTVTHKVGGGTVLGAG